MYQGGQEAHPRPEGDEAMTETQTTTTARDDITAEVVRINEGPFLMTLAMDTIAGASGEGEEAEGVFFDTIEIRRNGVLIETIRVEASEDPEPYDDAVAKFGPVRWL